MELESDLEAYSLHDFLEKLAGQCRLEDLTLTNPPLEDAVREMYRIGAAAPGAD